MTATSTTRRWAVSGSDVDLRGPRPAPSGKPLSVPARPQNITLDLARTALVIVDMQNDFCSDGGWLHAVGVDVTPAATAIAPINALTPLLRDRGVPIIWLNWGNRPDQANLPPNVRHVYDPRGDGGGIGATVAASDAVLTEGSWGAAIVADLTLGPRDVVVSKYRMSGFFDTPLDSILRQLRIDTVLFAGVNADQCVLATLTDAACLGYDAVLLEQASATTSPGFCLDATLYNVRQCFGFTATADDLVSVLTAATRSTHEGAHHGDRADPEAHR